MGIIQALDPKDLAESGWGVIFAHDADPEVRKALGQLLELRREQAGDYFRLFEGPDGHRPGESKNKFLARHGAGPGPVYPMKVPYYLLIVGSPERIPYRFQSQLDVQYAVGRIHFDSLEEYANYAASVVAAEGERDRQVYLEPEAVSFAVANPDDRASQLIQRYLVDPLHDALQSAQPGWNFSAYRAGEASKAQLARLLGGDQTPAFLFAAAHGMSFPLGSPRQLPHQGALLCQDWPGPRDWQGPIPQDYYFAGDDLGSDANLLGLIACFYASYSAGTSKSDEFARQAFKERAEIAPHSFLAQLPLKMLGHPRGGALAVAGLVEPAWGYSFDWSGAGAQTTVFESVLRRLLEGYPVGLALEYVNERYAELATVLSDELEEIDFGKKADPYELAGRWTANNDARAFAIVGDPAVRLPVAEAGQTPLERPQLEVKYVSPAEQVASIDDKDILDLY